MNDRTGHHPRLIPEGRIVVATRNRGKLREFRAMLEPAGLEVLGLADLAMDRDIDETGSTFLENARLKAVSYSQETDIPVLADDSGLEVFSLQGRPGIASARYAGAGATDEDRIMKLLAELGQAGGSRDARFVCALSLARRGGVRLETEGECRGKIIFEPRGAGGFGYDPIFFLPSLGKTMAELDESQKNRVSHRARALQQLLLLLNPQK